ncbi:MAG: sigma-70 family RNA polymerase sigma factor [Solirubrobacterales bacterium]
MSEPQFEPVATSAAGRSFARRSDRELLQRARAGSKAATEALVERHWDRAYRIAYGILRDDHMAEDVTQEAMVSMLSNLGRFDTRRSFEPWLHKIVTNRGIDWARARERREQTPTLVQPAVQEDATKLVLLDALGSLPVDQRAVVVLRHVAGYGTNEIARMLGIRRGTVGSRLRRGLDRLRSELEDQHG